MGRRTHVVTLALVGLLLVAGCGGGDGPTQDEKAAEQLSPPVFAQDADFPQQALQQALPTAKQVPGSRKVESRCRVGKATRSCAAAKGAVYAQVVLSVKGSQGTVGRNHRKAGVYWRPEAVDLTVKRFADVATADVGWDQQVEGQKFIDGSFDTKATKAGTTENWGVRGSGQVTTRKVLGLRSQQVQATLKDVDSASRLSPDMQVAVVSTRWGQSMLTTRVVYFDRGHQPGDAARQAQQLTEDYLRRLARTR